MYAAPNRSGNLVVIRACKLIDGSCIRCRWINHTGQPDGEVYRQCGVGLCPHLGEPLEQSWGVLLRVRCDCYENGVAEIWHTAHECSWKGNETERCLPTLIPLSVDRWNERGESKKYQCCDTCPFA